jgi:hypothetical protein
MRGLAGAVVGLSLVVTFYELQLKRYIIWLNFASWFHFIRFAFTGGRGALSIQEFHPIGNNFVARPFLSILPVPGAQAQSAFDIDQSALGQELVALLGKLAPGDYGKPLGFFFTFAFGGGVPPVRGDTE